MGGKGSGRLSRTDSLLRSTTQKLTPIANTGEDIFLPNNSGVADYLSKELGSNPLTSLTLRTNDTADPTLKFITTNTANTLNLYLDESESHNALICEGGSGTNTRLDVKSAGGEVAIMRLYQNATNYGELTYSGSTFRFSNTIDDGNISFNYKDGGVSKAIYIDADVNTLNMGDALLTTTGTITGVNVTSGADPGHTHTAYAASSHAMSTHSDEDTYNISTSGTAATGVLTVTGNCSWTGTASTTGDNSSADTAYVPMVLYNTDATPPAASGFPIGTIYIQYTA
jgi:hypothetical protein